MIVLHKCEVEPRDSKGVRVPGFHEEASGIAEDSGFKDFDVWNGRWRYYHR
jgi:hypothetical protein